MSLSMTGFSSHTAILKIKGAERMPVSVELKSLNSRFFELTCKLPSSISFLEIPIGNLLKEKLIRGRVFLSVKVGSGGDGFETVVPAIKVVKDYLAAVKTLKSELKIGGELTVSDLVHLPNVFSFERETVGKDFETAIMKVISDATDQLINSRKTEGASLQKDLKRRFELCDQYIEGIKKNYTEFMKQKKDEIKLLVASSESGSAESEAKVSEQYEFLNKIDIHEEIVRFQSHLKNVKKVLSSKEIEQGKKLEFILQELGREINTIAAKCSHYDISSASIDVKVELEKVREQVQNFV